MTQADHASSLTSERRTCEVMALGWAQCGVRSCLQPTATAASYKCAICGAELGFKGGRLFWHSAEDSDSDEPHVCSRGAKLGLKGMMPVLACSRGQRQRRAGTSRTWHNGTGSMWDACCGMQPRTATATSPSRRRRARAAAARTRGAGARAAAAAGAAACASVPRRGAAAPRPRPPGAPRLHA